jgi:DNA ligase 1
MIPEGKRFTFYRKSSFGISTWTLWYEGSVIYYGHSQSEGGAMSVHQELVELNMSGRNLEQQIELQMRSRLSRMLDKGYKATREEAVRGATNQLGFLNPMLAQPFQKIAVPNFTLAKVQPKYNGHRCLVANHEGQIIAYTRKGKLILTIQHILEKLGPRIPEGCTLDGELYVHGHSLQRISSLIKRMQPGNLELSFRMYDIAEDQVYSERWKYMQSIVEPVLSDKIQLAETHDVRDLAEALEWAEKFRAQKFEGGILRLDLAGYEDGKRSVQLIKLKEFLDADFKVISVKAGKDGVAIFTLQVAPGKTFDCLAPGTVPEKQFALQNPEKFIGRMLTVKYAELTDDGIPFHGVADQFVEEL